MLQAQLPLLALWEVVVVGAGPGWRKQVTVRALKGVLGLQAPNASLSHASA